MARPRKRLPPGSREIIIAMAREGALTETNIARNLGMTYPTWKRIRDENDDAHDLWLEAKAIARDRIIEKMRDLALEGDTNAAMFLLRALHDVSEKTPDTGDTMNVIVKLPASMPREEYAKVISPAKGEIGSDD